jgi:hypothetical protein
MRKPATTLALFLLFVTLPLNAQDFVPQALRCQAVTDYVSVPSNPLLQPNSGDFTFECWIRRTGNLNAQAGVIGKGAGLDVIEWQVQIYPNGQWQFDYGNRIYPVSSLILDMSWHHLAATVRRVGNSVTVTTYLDGQQDATASGVHSNAITNSDPLFIGANRVHDAAFIGYLDEVRLWNIARTQAEIQSTMGVTLVGNEPGLVAYWPFDGNLNDRTGNGNNGQFNGGAYLATSDAPIVYPATRFQYALDGSTLGLWHMNESSGQTVNDATVNANNGTSTGTAVVTGKFGNGRSFNGTSDYIDLPESSVLLSPGSGLTLEAWINIPSYPSNGQGNHIFSTGNQNDYDMSIYSDGRIAVALYLSSGPGTMFGNRSVPLNRWAHVAMT